MEVISKAAIMLVIYNKTDKIYDYEYIIETKKTKYPNVIKALVNWKGYCVRFNTWIDLSPEQVLNLVHSGPQILKEQSSNTLKRQPNSMKVNYKSNLDRSQKQGKTTNKERAKIHVAKGK